MNALGALGIMCVVFICLIPISWGIPSLTNPVKFKAELGKRVHKKLSVYYWDYLLIVIPILLLLIAFLSKDPVEQEQSLLILCLGYTFLILMQYGNRLHVRKINLWFLSICLVMVFASYLFEPIIEGQQFGSGHKVKSLFFAPFIAYCYVMIARWSIKKLTGSYPIAFVTSKDLGFIYSLNGRKANWWDVLWNIFNLTIIPLLLILTDNLVKYYL